MSHNTKKGQYKTRTVFKKSRTQQRTGNAENMTQTEQDTREQCTNRTACQENSVQREQCTTGHKDNKVNNKISTRRTVHQ